jgi:ABC-type phosphate transport system substrate-binding protein
MTRTHLLGAASAVALACFSTAHSLAAQSTIAGGGSTLAQYDYITEFNQYNAATSGAVFGTYYESGSGAGQNGLLLDDLTCDINKTTGANGGNCSGPAGAPGNTVDYGASDAVLSSAQISAWTTYQFGQPAAGNLIQLPSMGVGISIPVQNTAETKNGGLILQDADLCGVFSGKITDFSQLSANKGEVTPAAGPITVVYRNDGSGTSFLLTNHLSAVCNSSNSNITFSATTTFQTLFPNSTPPANFIGEKGSSGVDAEMLTLTSALAYLSPDFTSVDPNSGAPNHTLIVASILNGKTAELPTTKLISTALAHPKQGQNLTPPTNASEGANPALYVPLIQTVSAGYPIVGYTTFDFAQCYADPTIAAGIVAFMTDHYTNSSYLSIENNNGFVALANSGAAKFLTVIRQHILANSTKNNGPWDDDIQDKTACKGLVGR